MEITFTLKAPPFSINKAYYKRSFTRTKECREWGDSVLRQLQAATIQEDLQKFRIEFLSAPEASIGVRLRYFIPEEIFYTKKGDISRRSQDLSNVEKMLVDLIFDPRFCGRELSRGLICQNLNLDDKLITKLVSEKLPTELSHKIEVTLFLN